MVAAVYFVVSETFRRGDHINLNLVRSRMSPPLKTATSVLWLLPASLVYAIIAFGSAENVIESFRAGEYISGYLHWPIWLSYLPIALGSALLAVRLLNHATTLLFRGDDPLVTLDEDHEA
jgi:TRAP-type C4-dicarboxylate transport system permease small subunit